MNNMNRRELTGTSPLAVYAMASGANIAEGDIVCLDASGKAVEASDTAGLRVAGIAVHVDKASGTVRVRDGVVALDLAESDAPARGDRGKPVYAVGPTDVATTSSNAVCAGVLVDVHEGEAFVDVRPGCSAAAVAGSAAGSAAGTAAIAADLQKPGSAIKGATLNAPGNVRLVPAPSAANSNGTKGDIASDGTYLYLCTAANTWARVALALATW
jgi:hypothetical protein